MQIGIANIYIDNSLNIRDDIIWNAVDTYAEIFDQLPDITVFDVEPSTDEVPEGFYYLADGMHRIEAAKKLQKTEIGADVKKGTLKEAKAYALQANGKRGLPLNRSERTRATKSMITLFPERSDRWLAEDMGVSHPSVRKYREELESVGKIFQLDKFIGKDGKEYPRERKQPKRGEQAPDEQTAKAVKDMLIQHPERADSWIAEDMGVSHPSVRKYREELESTSRIAKLNKLIGKDGKERPREVPHPQRSEQVSDEPPTEPVEPELDDIEDEPIEAAAPVFRPEYPDEAEPEASDIEQTSSAEGFSQSEITPRIEVEEPESEDEPVEVVSPGAEVRRTRKRPLSFNLAPEETTAETQLEELCCYDHYVSLDEIKEYIGERVDVVVSGGGGKPVEYRGKVLGVTELVGKFFLNLRTDLGKKSIPIWTTTGHQTGIIEIKILSTEPTEPQTDWEKEGYATKEEYDAEYAAMMPDEDEEYNDDDEEEYSPVADTDAADDDEDDGNPEQWDVFVKNFDWIKTYAFELISQEDFHSASRIYTTLGALTKQLDMGLREGLE